MQATLSPQGFAAITSFFARESGIVLNESKRQLVVGRLMKLASRRGLSSLDSYVQEVVQGDDLLEQRAVIDALTTNETYFFREPRHFEFMTERLARMPRGTALRIWSAASSSGEEAYSIAMLLADKLGLDAGWEVIGTDLSSQMVEAATRGLYPLERAQKVPPHYLKAYCLRGEGDYSGQLLVTRELRQHVRFLQANLLQTLPDIGQFDLVFLRNVLIYFEPERKAEIVRRVIEKLRTGGFLFSGHAESLSGVEANLEPVQPAIYRKLAAGARRG